MNKRIVALVGAALIVGCGNPDVIDDNGDIAESEIRADGQQGPGTAIPAEEVAHDEAAPQLARVETKVVLPYTWYGQPNGYWCGPGSTRIALSARMENPPTQQTLATYMGTTTNGTDFIGLPVKALNKWLTPAVPYVTREITDPPTQAQRDRLKSDLLARLGSGYPMVANVVSGWRPPNYPSGTIYHYVAVVGYDEGGDKVLIADPAAVGSAGASWANVPKTYWVSLHNLAVWIGGKGYTG